MQTLKPTEADKTGGGYVQNWLNENGFVDVVLSSVNDSMNFIEANGTIENILVYFVCATSPSEPGKIDDAIRSKIKGAAESLGRKAYVAYVSLTTDNSLEGDINWQRIS
jgi:hypothetical protein